MKKQKQISILKTWAKTEFYIETEKKKKHKKQTEFPKTGDEIKENLEQKIGPSK